MKKKVTTGKAKKITNSNARVNTSYNKKTDSLLLAFGMAVYTGMSTGGFFETPPFPYADLLETLSAYQDAMAAAASRDADKITARNLLRVQVLDLLMSLANYVNFAGEGDFQSMSSSRFEMRKTSVATAPLQKPENIRTTEGINAGEINIFCIRPRFALAFILHFRPQLDGIESPWKSITSGSCSFTVSGLIKAASYQFTISAIGVRDQLTISDITSRIAQ